jgi:hypothetical protein
MNYIRSSVLLAGIGLLTAPVLRAAGTLQSAEVTRVYNKVELLAPDQAAKPAQVGDGITGSTAVQTGNQARAELRFNDESIARLGANSVFSFDRGTRDLNLNEGVILLEVPKNAGGATINTAAVTAAITGTTVMIETHKAAKGGKGIVKFIVLEGTMRLSLNGHLGESILLHAGEMVAFSPGDSSFPAIQIVDVAKLTKTSGLMSKQFGPLKNAPFIFQTEKTQHVLKTKGKLVTVNYALLGKKKNPVLQVINNNNQAGLRTDADGAPAPKPKKVAVIRTSHIVTHTSPKPPTPPKPPVVHRPKPPLQPKPPSRPQPPAPPAVPPAPPTRS